MSNEVTTGGASAVNSPSRSGSNSALIWVAILLIVVGMIAIAFGLRYATGSATSGSSSIVDTTYRRVPAGSDVPWLESFTLTERSGKLVGSDELKGSPYVTSFFFAACPSICMQQNQKVADAAREYGPKGVKFVSITCDPENDTPSQLREYAHRLNADADHWWFLTGDLTYIRRVAGEMFLVALDKQTHSENLIVSDKWGNIRGQYHWNDPAEMTKLKRQLDELLAEETEPEEFQKQKAEAAAAKKSADDAANTDKVPTAKTESDSSEGTSDKDATE